MTEPDMRDAAALFGAAAAALQAGSVPAGRVQALLSDLGYLDRAIALLPHRQAVLYGAAGFRRLFTLAAPDAPGLVVMGGEVDPGVPGSPLGSASGTGDTLGAALESCVGEGIEYCSQFAMPGDPLVRLNDADALTAGPPGLAEMWKRLRPWQRREAGEVPDWVVVARLSDGAAVPMPADLCLRRPAGQRRLTPPWPMSTGCAAGMDLLGATVHGLLELIERDAVALWWRGGQRAHLIFEGSAAATLARLRQEATGRRSWLLDITGDLGVPVVVAASCAEDGLGLCCGFAARPTRALAAEAALREMAQMELGWHLAATKERLNGAAALNEGDRRHLRRCRETDAATPALQPMAPPRPAQDLPACEGAELLRALRHRLERAGMQPCALDLTRERYGIPVVRVLCPGLESGLDGPPGPRLTDAAARSGVNPLAAPAL